MNNNVIKALCNPTRIKILQCLSEGDKTVTELIDTCGLAQSAVSQHLVKLKSSGLVTDQKIGRKVYYSLPNKEISKITNLIINLAKEE